MELRHPLDSIQAIKDLLPILRLEILYTLLECLFSISEGLLRSVVVGGSLRASWAQGRVLQGLGLYLSFLGGILALLRCLKVVPHHTRLAQLHIGVDGGCSLL